MWELSKLAGEDTAACSCRKQDVNVQCQKRQILRRLRTFLKHPGVPMRQLKEFAACLFLTVLIDSWRRLLFRAKGGLTHGMRGSDSLLRILCQQSAQHDQ
jgi:hypothetical protein